MGSTCSCTESYAKAHNIPFTLIGMKPIPASGDINGDDSFNLKHTVLLRRFIDGG